MPTSFPENIPQVLHAVRDANPKTVLDIGFGRGKYGFLIKEYYPDVKVDGMDVFPDYVTDLQREIYDTITVDNALTAEIPQYDLYLIIDVLEHWPVDEGLALLRKLRTMGKVLISTPRSVQHQGAEFGNEWECHVSQWQGEYFNEFEPRKEYFNDFSFMFLLG